MKYLLQIKDAEGELTQMDCDDYTFQIDTERLALYAGEGDQKELIGSFQKPIYFKRLKQPKDK